MTIEPIFHAGELAVQEQAGVREMAQRVGRSIKADMPAVAQAFLQEQPLAIVASSDAAGRVWASVLTGPPGFLQAVDERTVHIDADPPASDPLAANLRLEADIGLLVIDFAARRRMRINGRARLQPEGGFYLAARQVYSNCPKYIQARAVEPGDRTERTPSRVQRGHSLTERQQRWLAQADTFFIASAHPESGADASHRGGDPGFVSVAGPRRLAWPDYTGNMMFNTLGNIAVNPQAGLLFFDFDRGGTLQLTGRAAVSWEAADIEQYRGAERVVTYQIEQVVETEQALPLDWRFESYSPFNP